MSQQALENHQKVTLFMGLCALGLLSVWALPETIAFRHIFLGFGLVSSLFFLRSKINILTNLRAWPLWVLLGVYIWLTLHLWFFSAQPSIQFHELRSIWLRSLGVLPLGLGLGICLSTENSRDGRQSLQQERISLLLFLGFASTPVIFMAGYIYKCYEAKQWIPMEAIAWWSIPYLQKPPFVVATALLLPICCVLISGVLRGRRRLWWAMLSIVAIGLCVASNYLTNTKNGMAMVAITICLFGIYSIWHIALTWAKQSIIKGLLSILMAIFILTGVGWGIKLHIDKNPAWSQLIPNAKIGIDIDHQKYWRNRNVYSAVPTNELDTPVDVSTYERTAWFTAGLRLLAERPQGYGLVHHSFGWMALERWPDFYPPIGTLRGMTHSGWMDLTLGIGIPGLLLILIPLGATWYRSLGKDNLWASYASWAIPIFTLTYLTTEVTGAHHFIELMMFMVAFFVGLTITSAPSHSHQDSLAVDATKSVAS
jgi:hypothetical protein